MTGINTKRTVHRRRHFIDDLLHHFFFINTIHSHIDIENACTVLLLRHRHLANQIQSALAKLCLQLLFAGRIDTLADHDKSTVQCNFYILSFRG